MPLTLEDFSDFRVAPLPPTPLLGVDPELDRLLGLALAGNQQIAAIYAHAFQVQHQLVTYAFYILGEITDPTQKQYVEALINQLTKAMNHGVMSVATGAARQVNTMTQASLAPLPPAPQKLSAWEEAKAGMMDVWGPVLEGMSLGLYRKR